MEQRHSVNPRFFTDTPEVQALRYYHKQVLFLPIHHIGRKEYYNQVAHLTDSLEDAGYTVFYEQLSTNLPDLESFERVARKYRKLTGSFSTSVQAGDTSAFRKNGLVNQPNAESLGVNLDKALLADVTLEQLIASFEERYGQITLDSCDLQTELDAQYQCDLLNSKLQRRFQKEFVLGMRNAHLANLIHYSPARKIFVIYGASHYKGLRVELKKLDSNWEWR